MKKNTIIIGAGLIGASTALALIRRGESVTILDYKTGPGQGASFANGGMLTPSMADPWNSPGVWRDLLRYYGKSDAPMLLRTHALPSLAMWGAKFLGASTKRKYERATAMNVRLGLFSLSVMSRWRRDMNLSYDGAQHGTVKIYRDAKALSDGLMKSEKMRALGIKYELLPAKILAERHPALEPIHDTLEGGIYFPSDESGDSFKFTQELIARVVELGGDVRWGVNVKKILSKNDKVTGVALKNGDVICAERIVIAMGANSPALSSHVGISLQVKPVKGYSITFSGDMIQQKQRLNIPVVDDGLHAAVTPLGDNIRVAGTAEFTGFDTCLNESRLENLRKIICEILPDQAPTLLENELYCWANFRPVHAHGTPIIGPAPLRGAFINTGHGHLGWTQAAGSGEALAQLITRDTPTFDLSAYYP